MNYYDHHIGDYDADTAHLTWLEDMAYTRLMRLYYRKESPIPVDVAQACRLVRATSKDERKAVETVLNEFFDLRDDGWHQARCDAEVAAYQARVEHNRRVGKKGGRPRKVETQVEPEKNQSGNSKKPKQNPPGYLREPEQNPPQSPVPIPQVYSEPNGSDAAGVKPGDPPPADPPKPPMEPDEIIFGYGVPLLVNAGSADKAARSFLGGLRKQHGDAAVIDKLRDCIRAKPLQPLEWLAAALPPKAAPGKHAGFQNLNYREGVSADGSLV